MSPNNPLILLHNLLVQLACNLYKLQAILQATNLSLYQIPISIPANDQDVSVTITTQQGQLLNYSCPCEPSVNQPATSTPGNEGGVSLGTVALAVGGSAIVVAGVVVAVLLLWFYWRKSPKKVSVRSGGSWT